MIISCRFGVPLLAAVRCARSAIPACRRRSQFAATCFQQPRALGQPAVGAYASEAPTIGRRPIAAAISGERRARSEFRAHPKSLAQFEDGAAALDRCASRVLPQCLMGQKLRPVGSGFQERSVRPTATDAPRRNTRRSSPSPIARLQGFERFGQSQRSPTLRTLHCSDRG